MYRKPTIPPYRFERLESRLLLSADPLSAVVGLLAPDAANDHEFKYGDTPTLSTAVVPADDVNSNDSIGIDDVTDAFGGPIADTHSILFVDSSIENYHQLLTDLAGSVEVVVLNSNEDGIDQIAEYLNSKSDIDAIHIASHGNGDGLWLGNSFLNHQTLESRAIDIASWSDALNDGADLLLYGCNLASTDSGQSLLESLAKLTSTDVAASENLTGSSSAGGDWVLEFSTGQITHNAVFSASAQANWAGTLEAVTVTTTADLVDLDADTSSLANLKLTPGSDGLISLREAIIAANQDASADIIFLGAGNYAITQITIDDFGGDFDIRNDLSIVGTSPNTTFINGNSWSSVFDIHDDANITVSISNLKIENGLTTILSTPNINGAGMNIRGIANSPVVYLSNVWFFNNDTNGLLDQGGAIYNASELYITNSLFENNTSDDGGAIFNASGATVKITNTTFSNNSATNGDGGAIKNLGSADLTNVTITLGSVSGGDGDGLYTDVGGTTSLTNSIVAGNGSGDGDIHGSVTSGGNNIIGDDTDASGFVGSDQRNVDPLLGLLVDNGGDLKTHAPGAGSTAIDAANLSLSPDTDQIGFKRGGSPDIGAFEVGASSLPAQGTLWFTTDQGVSSGGQLGLDSWDGADVMSFDDPLLNLGTGTSSGSVANIIDFGAASPQFAGMHFVSTDVSIAGGAFQLRAGDVLFNSESNLAVFNSNSALPLEAGFSATVTADRRDIVVFRPDTLGDYSLGQYAFLIDDPDGGDLRAFSLVEKTTVVGGTTLNAGDFLFVRNGAGLDQDIRWFAPTTIGDGTTAGAVAILLDGDDPNVNIGEQIHGLELIEETVNVGGVTLSTGQILVSIQGDNTVGVNNLPVSKNDIFIVNVEQSTVAAGSGNGVANAAKFLTGEDVGFDTNEERFNSLAISTTSASPIADASAGAPHTITAGNTIAFDGSNSSDPDGAIATYEWDINNDGSFEKTGLNVSYSWSELNAAGINSNGAFNVALKVTDNEGNIASTIFTLTVNNAAPTLTAFAAAIDTTDEDTEVEITFAELAAQGDDADVDGTVDSFVVQAVSSGTLRIGADAVSATAFAVGTNDVIGAGLNAYWTPANNQNGTLNAFTVTAKDNDGAQSGTPITAQVNVSDVNDAPTLTTFAAAIDTTDEDTEVEITFAELAAQGDDADVDGTVDSFIVQAVSSGTLRIGADAVSATAFAVGTNDVIGAGLNAYWTPANNQNGTLNAFTVTAKDNDGAQSGTPITAQVNVSDVNDAPTLTTFAAAIDTTSQNVELEITFAEIAAQGNETDVDGTVDSFVVQAISSGTLRIGANAASATAFAVGTNDVIGPGLNGYWTPALNQNGTLNAFTLEARDNDGALSGSPVTAQVAVNAVNLPPSLDQNNVTITEGGTTLITPADLSASDVDNGPSNLTFTASNITHGQFERVGAAGMAVSSFTQADIQSGSVRFVHDGSENAPGFSITVSDGANSTAVTPAVILFSNVNDAPNIILNKLAIEQNGTVTLTVNSNVTASDSDNDANDLVYRVSGLSGGHFELIGNPGTQVSGFSQQDLAAGIVRFIHDGSSISPSYTLTVSDGEADSTASQVTVNFTPNAGEFFSSEAAAAADFASSESLDQTNKPFAEEPNSTKASDDSDAKEQTDDAIQQEHALAIQEINEAAKQARAAEALLEDRVETFEKQLREDNKSRHQTLTTLSSLLSSQLKLSVAAADSLADRVTASIDVMTAVVQSSNFKNGLDSLRQEMAGEHFIEKTQIGTSVAVSTGLSIGYVVWLIRGGILVSSMLSALPAWRLIDPLPILAFASGDEEEDDESLESIVSGAQSMSDDDALENTKDKQ